MRRTRFCPAKVNLFLEVTGKRPNGYHELSTLFAKIDLGDWVTVDVTPAKKTSISLQVTGPRRAGIPANAHNLVCKAAQEDPFELLETAAQLGADVPLFLYPQTFLKGEGIGEKLTPLPAADSLPYLLLIYPCTAVSTKQVFARMHVASSADILTNTTKLDKLMDAVRKGLPAKEWGPLLFNRLEEFVLPFEPCILETLRLLQQANEGTGIMSGSGSTVFTLVGTKQHVQELAAKLQHAKRLVFPVSFYRGPTDADYGDKSSSHG